MVSTLGSYWYTDNTGSTGTYFWEASMSSVIVASIPGPNLSLRCLQYANQALTPAYIAGSMLEYCKQHKLGLGPGKEANIITHKTMVSTSTSEASDSSLPTLLAKPKALSPVWAHFGFEANEDGKPKSKDRVVCRLCKCHVVSKGGNTSNLFSHLRVHHPLNFQS